MELALGCTIMLTCIFSTFVRSNLRYAIICMLLSFLVSCHIFTYTNMKIYGILIALSYVALFLAIFIINRVTQYTKIHYKKQLLCLVIGNAFSVIIVHFLNKDGNSYFLQNVVGIQKICSQNIGIYLMISLILFSCFAAVSLLLKNTSSINLLSIHNGDSTTSQSIYSVKLIDISGKENV